MAIEHVLPRKWVVRWQQPAPPDTPESHDRLLHTIGNLTLLTLRLNSKVSNLPYRIQEVGSTTDFLYGPDRQRIRQAASSSARGRRLTYFFSGLYEEEVFSTYANRKHHVSGQVPPAPADTRDGPQLAQTGLEAPFSVDLTA